jgi:hypothetical protein
LQNVRVAFAQPVWQPREYMEGDLPAPSRCQLLDVALTLPTWIFAHPRTLTNRKEKLPRLCRKPVLLPHNTSPFCTMHPIEKIILFGAQFWQ